MKNKEEFIDYNLVARIGWTISFAFFAFLTIISDSNYQRIFFSIFSLGSAYFYFDYSKKYCFTDKSLLIKQFNHLTILNYDSIQSIFLSTLDKNPCINLLTDNKLIQIKVNTKTAIHIKKMYNNIYNRILNNMHKDIENIKFKNNKYEIHKNKIITNKKTYYFSEIKPVNIKIFRENLTDISYSICTMETIQNQKITIYSNKLHGIHFMDIYNKFNLTTAST